MSKKKDRVITLRVSEDDFTIVESFAKAKGLSVSAYINSVIKSQTEYFIPTASNQKVSIPKSILYSLFSYASKENLDDLGNHWAIEQEHVTRLIWGEINLHSLLDVIFKISKYMMGTDARVITTTADAQQVKENIKKYVDETLPEEYNKCLVGLNSILKEAWGVSQQANDSRIEKIKALMLAKECYAMKLELLTNATVVNDAMRFVSSHTVAAKTEKYNAQYHVTLDKDGVNDIQRAYEGHNRQQPTTWTASTNNTIF
ncbi:MAG: hypothetical protein WBX81_16690 [Nitrososphaeraceae archaeon]